MASAGLSPRHGQPPNRQPHREAPSKQVSEASTEAHCWRLPRCASAPRGRANLARGAARGHGRERRRAEATGAGCSCWLSAHGEAAAGGPDTAPRGSSACPPARVSTAVSRRVQPSSPAARAAAGRLSQHLPAVSHTPLRDTGGLCPHARAPTAARSLRSRRGGKNQNSKTKRCGEERARLAEVRRLPSPPSRGGSTAAGERGQVRQSVRRSPVRAGSAGRTCIRRTRRPCGLGHDSAAGPSSHVGSLGPGGRERGRSADAGGEELGLGESDGRSEEEPRRCTAAEAGWSPQQSPRILR